MGADVSANFCLLSKLDRFISFLASLFFSTENATGVKEGSNRCLLLSLSLSSSFKQNVAGLLHFFLKEREKMKN